MTKLPRGTYDKADKDVIMKMTKMNSTLYESNAVVKLHHQENVPLHNLG